MSKHMMDGLLLWFLHWAKSAGAHGGLRVLSDLDAQDIKNASIDDDLFVNRAAHVLLERLLFRGGTVLIPVYIGRGWSGVVVRDIQKVVPSVAQAVLDDDAQPDAGAFVIFISTHAGNGDTEVDFCFDVVNGLFHSLTAAICQTCLRHMDYVGIGTFFNGCLRTRLPERWVTTPDRELAETADHLLAYFALLLFAERKAADCLFRTDNGLKWIKFHAPRQLRGLCRGIYEAHRLEGEVWNEQEPGEELFNGRELSEDEVADSADGMRDLADDEEAGGDGSTRNAGRDGDVVADGRPHGGGKRLGRGGGRVGGYGRHVGTNDDAAGDVVADNGRHGGGQRHRSCEEHIVVDGGLVHRSNGGDAGGNACGHGVGANGNATADTVVDDRRHGGDHRKGRGGRHVAVNGEAVHARNAGDASGHALGDGVSAK